MFASFVRDTIIFFTEMRSVLSWRRCTGHREDNGRQIHEGHRRLHQRPCIGLGLLGRPVVARAGDQHALVHPMKERYPCRPTSGSGVVGSIPKLGYENLRITNRIAAKWIARKSAPARECICVFRASRARFITFVQTHPSTDGTFEKMGIEWIDNRPVVVRVPSSGTYIGGFTVNINRAIRAERCLSLASWHRSSVQRLSVGSYINWSRRRRFNWGRWINESTKWLSYDGITRYRKIMKG